MDLFDGKAVLFPEMGTVTGCLWYRLCFPPSRLPLRCVLNSLIFHKSVGCGKVRNQLVHPDLAFCFFIC